MQTIMKWILENSTAKKGTQNRFGSQIGPKWNMATGNSWSAHDLLKANASALKTILVFNCRYLHDIVTQSACIYVRTVNFSLFGYTIYQINEIYKDRKVWCSMKAKERKGKKFVEVSLWCGTRCTLNMYCGFINRKPYNRASMSTYFIVFSFFFRNF